MKRIFHSNGVEIVKHCKGCYSLRYLGTPVLCRCSFKLCARYYWCEFAPEIP